MLVFAVQNSFSKVEYTLEEIPLFFNSSQPSALHGQCIAALTEQFRVSEDTAQKWCQADKKRVKITLPFAAQSVWQELLTALDEKGADVDQIDLVTDIPRYNCQGTPLAKSQQCNSCGIR